MSILGMNQKDMFWRFYLQYKNIRIQGKKWNFRKNVEKYRKGGKIQHEHTCGTRSPVLCLNLSRGQEATQITLTIPYNATLHLHIGKLFCFASDYSL